MKALIFLIVISLSFTIFAIVMGVKEYKQEQRIEENASYNTYIFGDHQIRCKFVTMHACGMTLNYCKDGKSYTCVNNLTHMEELE